jgi:Rod binding domain-containing protein
MQDINAIAGTSPQPQLSADETPDTNAAAGARKAGQQFEALMIAELLRMTHSEEGGWLGSGEESANSAAMGVAEESLAQAFSSTGGFGLAALVTKSLTAAQHPPETTRKISD